METGSGWLSWACVGPIYKARTVGGPEDSEMLLCNLQLDSQQVGRREQTGIGRIEELRVQKQKGLSCMGLDGVETDMRGVRAVP